MDVIEELLKEDEEDEKHDGETVLRLSALWDTLTMVKPPFWMRSVTRNVTGREAGGITQHIGAIRCRDQRREDYIPGYSGT